LGGREQSHALPPVYIFVSQNLQSVIVQNPNFVHCISKDFGHNKYATKKTITQGLLDVALLTANASQLKFLLEVGESHPYYVLLLTLLAVSLALQVSLTPQSTVRRADVCHVTWYSLIGFINVSQGSNTSTILP
jgi:hypothetical protein